jgi:hypothetical protein
MSEQDWSRILDQLERVKTMAERAATPGEAEAAAAALTRLLTRYNLSVAELDHRLGNAARDNFAQDTVALGARTAWRRLLLATIARHHFCRALSLSGTDRAYLVGERRNLDVTRDLYATLVLEIDRMTHAAWSDALRDGSAARDEARSWKHAYRLGAVAGIDNAMYRARAAAIADVGSGSALVALKDEQADAAVRKFFPNTAKQRPARFSGAGRAYATGRRDGQRVDVDRRAAIAG